MATPQPQDSPAADERASALYKLEPIKSPAVGSSPPPMLPRSISRGGSGRVLSVGSVGSEGESPTSIGNMTRSRRASQDEIRALLQRTTAALDRIVQIRESMEPYVDFQQFRKPPTHKRRPPSRLSSAAVLDAPDRPSEMRSTPSNSYGSTESSSLSSTTSDPLADPLADRSTNSTSRSEGSSHHDESELGTLSSARSITSNPVLDEDHAVGDFHATSETHDEDEEDDDRDSDLSSATGELTPLKEARLERLKHIEVSFVEGLPREFFQALCRFLFSVVDIKTRHSRFNFYKDTFTGADAVREMVLNGFADDQSAALRLGNVLVRLGFIEHVSRTDDQLHNSKDNFYRFTRVLEYDDAAESFAADAAVRRRTSVTANNYRDSVLSRESAGCIDYDFTTASDEVHALVTDETLPIFARVLLKVFERKNKLLFYKGFVGCFLGAEAVNVMRELRIATSLIDAVLIGQSLLDEGLVEPIATTVSSFQDKYVFYRLTKMQSSNAHPLASPTRESRSESDDGSDGESRL